MKGRWSISKKIVFEHTKEHNHNRTDGRDHQFCKEDDVDRLPSPDGNGKIVLHGARSHIPDQEDNLKQLKLHY